MAPRHSKASDDQPTQGTHYSESLARGLAVLKAFDRQAPLQTVGEIADRTGISRAAARRFLLTLQDLGYVGINGNQFFLTPLVLDIGYKYLASADITFLVQPLLNELAEKTNEAATLAVLDGLDCLVVARATKRDWDISVGSGSRLPATRTSLGLVLLAYLPGPQQRSTIAALRSATPNADAFNKRLAQVRVDGFAKVQHDLIPGWSALALPINGPEGQVAAAINISSYDETASKKSALDGFRPLLEQAKLQIEMALRAAPIPLRFGRPPAPPSTK